MGEKIGRNIEIIESPIQIISECTPSNTYNKYLKGKSYILFFGTLNYIKGSYDYKKELLDQYENQEIFDVYTRGFLWAMSTYVIRQNYFEVGSPLLDIDFLEMCFSIPIKYRKQHNNYLKWIKRYYKGATKYRWEKWAGVPPKQEFA